MSVTTMTNDAEQAAGQAPKSGKKKLLGVVTVFALVAGASWVYLRPAEADPAPEPGEVLRLDAIQLNLAGGSYLRVGIALQASADVEEELEGSKALDATIELFSGRQMEDLAQPMQRKVLKDKLLKELEKRYHGEVIDVYFTDFVTQ
jgi:flagellar FliL protein